MPATWFYYDNDGQKRGPVTGGQLKGLAKAGIISPETIVETDTGKQETCSEIQKQLCLFYQKMLYLVKQVSF